MSVPPSPTVPAAPAKPPQDGAKKFGSVPIGGFVTMALVTAAGIVTYVLTATATVVAMCGDDRMTPNMVCDTETNGIVTNTETYGQVLAAARRANTVGQWTGIALIVIGVVFAVLLYVRWQQDRQLKGQLRDDHGPPLSSHGRTASSSFFGIVVGAGLIALAGYFLLSGIGKDEWPYFIGTAFAGLGGLALLYVALPKNGQLVQVFDPGVRVASRGRVTELPWRDVSYKIVPGKGTASHFISGPGVASIALASLNDSDALQQVAQQHSARARYPVAIEAINRGERVAFGKLGVSREGIGAGRKVLPWSHYAGLVLNQGQVTVAQVGQARFTMISLGQIENYFVLVNVVDTVAKQVPRTSA